MEKRNYGQYQMIYVASFLNIIIQICELICELLQM